jgi:hypothetical protein
LSQTTNSEIPDPRWKDLYRIGGISSLLIAASILFAIVAFFIWPFKPGFTSTENIFQSLQVDRLGGLMSLDLMMLLIVLMNIFPFLAMYVALKQVNESYALIALILTLTAIVLLIPTRPLVEMVYLSDKYAMATTTAEKASYLAAGETLHTLFNGTAWVVQTVLFLVSGLINSLLMLRSRFFKNATAWTGIIISLIGAGFFLPVVGIILLFVNTIGSIIWFILLAPDFFKLTRQIQAQSNKE